MAAAKTVNIDIPSLCAMPEIDHAPGACRVCLVEVERSKTLVASCVYPVANGMKVKTNSARVRRARRAVVEFLLSDHPQDCTICQKTRPLRAAEIGRTGRSTGHHRGAHRFQHSPNRRFISQPDPRQLQMHQLPALRYSLRTSAGRESAYPRREGIYFQGGTGAEQIPGRIRLHLLRPVRRGLPHRCHHGKG